MSKTIVIQEGGLGKQLTVDKLKTNLVGGGTCLWVPEDAITLGTKSIYDNGTYYASDDGYYGYSSVSVSGIGNVVGEKDDGNEYEVTTDNGVIVEQKIPSSIKITHNPNKMTYNDGEAINYSGMIVTAYDANGESMGTLALSELILPITNADSSQATIYEGGGVSAIKLMYTRRVTWYQYDQREEIVYCSDYPISTDEKGRAESLGANFMAEVLVTKYNNTVYIRRIQGDDGIIRFTHCNGNGAPWSNKEIKGWHPSAYSSGRTRTNSFDTGAPPFSGDINLPESTVTPGSQTLNPAGQTIPVKYARPGDGKELEATFNIQIV